VNISFPIKTHNGEKWAELSHYGLAHEICGEKVFQKDQMFSFAGGHRVRLYAFKKNVHWKIPVGSTLDISEVDAPRKKAPRASGRAS
jgi:hypothetical protein